eukprot:scaffold116570_cov24-Attheya_sp.AAC.1
MYGVRAGPRPALIGLVIIIGTGWLLLLGGGWPLIVLVGIILVGVGIVIHVLVMMMVHMMDFAVAVGALNDAPIGND